VRRAYPRFCTHTPCPLDSSANLSYAVGEICPNRSASLNKSSSPPF
jgi:hypothetical protein